MKKQLRSETSMQEGLSLDVSHVVDQLVQLDTAYRRIDGKVRRLGVRCEEEIPALVRRIEMVAAAATRGHGGGRGRGGRRK